MQTEKYRTISVGLRAARANLIPALIIQLAIISIVLSYYFWEPMREWLTRLAEIKRQGGYLFSFISGIVAGGLLPELLTVAVFQRWRVRRENLSNLIFAASFWGVMAMIVDTIYRLQSWMFGPHVDLATVLKKTLVDQIIITPLITIPFTVIVLEWKHQGYRFDGLSRVFTVRFYKQKILPTSVSGLGFWLPIVALIYSLPPLLQLPLFTLALTLWVMIITWISHSQKDYVSEIEIKAG
jgi:hypothetical protein